MLNVAVVRLRFEGYFTEVSIYIVGFTQISSKIQSERQNTNQLDLHFVSFPLQPECVNDPPLEGFAMGVISIS